MDVEELRAKAREKRAGKSLRSPIEPREYILATGMGGTGKSSKILDVARVCPQDTFFAIDSELFNFQRLLATEYTDVTNVRIYKPQEWDDWKRSIKEISGLMKVDHENPYGEPVSHDWIVLDSATPTWDAVQGWFISKVHGEEADDWFLQKRIQNQRINDGPGNEKVRGLAALSGGDGDWQVINKQYFKHIYYALMLCAGHKYVTAEQDAIGQDDDREVRGMYGPYGFKPKGQKRLGYVPMTSLWFTKKRVGEWYMTTVKDRGRPEVEDEPLRDFAEDYLVKLAGFTYE